MAANVEPLPVPLASGVASVNAPVVVNAPAASGLIEGEELDTSADVVPETSEEEAA